MAKVTITLELGDQVVDTAVATMPDAALQLAIEAMAQAHGWEKTIPNPDFNAGNEESEENPASISNPVSKARHFSYRLRLFAESRAAEYVQRIAAEQAAEGARKQFTDLARLITVE